MAGIDLDPIREILEGFFNAKVSVTRASDVAPVFDRNTGQYSEVARVAVLTNVDAMFTPPSKQDVVSSEGGVQTNEQEPTLFLKMETPPLKYADAVEILECYDPDFVGFVFYIWQEMEPSSFSVAKKYVLSLENPRERA